MNIFSRVCSVVVLPETYFFRNQTFSYKHLFYCFAKIVGCMMCMVRLRRGHPSIQTSCFMHIKPFVRLDLGLEYWLQIFIMNSLLLKLFVIMYRSTGSLPTRAFENQQYQRCYRSKIYTYTKWAKSPCKFFQLEQICKSFKIILRSARYFSFNKALFNYLALFLN